MSEKFRIIFRKVNNPDEIYISPKLSSEENEKYDQLNDLLSKYNENKGIIANEKLRCGKQIFLAKDDDDWKRVNITHIPNDLNDQVSCLLLDELKMIKVNKTSIHMAPVMYRKLPRIIYPCFLANISPNISFNENNTSPGTEICTTWHEKGLKFLKIVLNNNAKSGAKASFLGDMDDSLKFPIDIFVVSKFGDQCFNDALVRFKFAIENKKQYEDLSSNRFWKIDNNYDNSADDLANQLEPYEDVRYKQKEQSKSLSEEDEDFQMGDDNIIFNNIKCDSNDAFDEVIFSKPFNKSTEINESYIHKSKKYTISVDEMKKEQNLTRHFYINGKLKSPELSNERLRERINSQLLQTLAMMRFGDIIPELHRHIWPIIQLMENILVVSTQRNQSRSCYTLKNLSFLIPIMNGIIDEDIEITGNGPICIILVSSWQKSNSLQDLIEFISNIVKLNIVTKCMYENGEKLRDENSLLEGCDILVSTPSYLIQHLKTEMLCLSRLTYLVFDDADILSKELINPLNEFVKYVNMVSRQRQREAGKMSIQKLIFASEWTPYLLKFTQNIMTSVEYQQLVKVIGNQFETSIYGNVLHEAIYTGENEKDEKLIELMNRISSLETPQCKFVTIFARDTSEVDHLVKLLAKFEYNLIHDHHGMSSDKITKNSLVWKSSDKVQMNVLVITDTVNDYFTTITNTTHLIHYQMPTNTREFGERLSFGLDNYKPHDMECKQDIENLRSYLLISKDDHPKISRIIQVLNRTNENNPDNLIPIPKVILDIGHQSTYCKTRNINLCKLFKSFGFCREVGCNQRHEIICEKDTPNTNIKYSKIPLSGFAKFRITNIESGCHYYVQLLESKEDYINKRSHLNDLMYIDGLMNLMTIRNTKTLAHDDIKIGVLCAYKDDEEKFHRVEIENLAESSQYGYDIYVQICFVDTGGHLNTYSNNLYLLKDSAKTVPYQCVEVILCRTMPLDYDGQYTNKAKNIMMSYVNNKVVEGQIVLALHNTMFMENLVFSENKHFKYSLRNYFLQTKLCVNNSMHMYNLRKQCKHDNIELPDRIKQLAYINNGLYFSQNCEELFSEQNGNYVRESTYKVNVTAIADVSQFYVVKEENREIIRALDEEIQNFTNRLDGIKQMETYTQQLKNCETVDEEHEISLVNKQLKYQKEETSNVPYGDDMIVLGIINNNNRWCRCKIIEVTTIDEEECYDLLCLDTGESDLVSADCIRDIPISLMNKIKFQAIYCSLYGIKTYDYKDSTNIESDKLWEITHDSENNVISCTLEVMSNILDDIASPDVRYNVNIFTPNSLFPISTELCIMGFGNVNIDVITKIFDVDKPDLESCIVLKKYMIDREDFQKVKDISCISIDDTKQFITLISNCLPYLWTEEAIYIQNIINTNFSSIKDQIDQNTLLCLCKIVIYCFNKRFEVGDEYINSLMNLLYTISKHETCIGYLCNYGIFDIILHFLKTDSRHQILQMIKITDNLLETKTKTVIFIASQCEIVEKFSEFFVTFFTQFMNNQEFDQKLFEIIIFSFKVINQFSLYEKTKVKFKFHNLIKPMFKLIICDNLNSSTHDRFKENLLKFIIRICKTNLFYKQILFSNENLMGHLKRLMSTIVICENLLTSIQELIIENDEFHNTIERDISVSSLLKSATPVKKVPLKNKQKEEIQFKVNPKVKWFQTLSYLLLTVQIPDVNETDDICDISDSCIKFKAQVEETLHHFQMNLFAAIDISKTTVKINDSEILIDLTKNISVLWPRFTIEKIKPHFLVYDYDKICDDEFEMSNEKSNVLSTINFINTKDTCDINRYKGLQGAPDMEDSDKDEIEEEEDIEQLYEHKNNDYYNF